MATTISAGIQQGTSDQIRPVMTLPPVPSEQRSSPLPSQILAHTSKCHFLAAFTVNAAANTSVSASEEVLNHVTSWIQKFIPFFPPGNPAQRKNFDSKTFMHQDVQLSTLLHDTASLAPDSAALLACALEHTDRHLSGRRWRTEIVIQESSDGSAKICIGVYHGLRREYVGPPLISPTPSTPSFVSSLLRDHRIECFYDGRKAFTRPLAVDDSVASASSFLKLLLSPARTTPLVLLNSCTAEHGGDYRWDPREITKACIGSGTIVVARTALEPQGPFLSTVANNLGERGRRYISGITNGGVRVYQPQLELTHPLDPTRHRYFRPEDGPDVPGWIRDGLRDSLRVSLDERQAVSTFEGVRQAINQAAELRRLDQLQERVTKAMTAAADPHIDKQIAEVTTLVSDLQRELEPLRYASAELATTKAQLAAKADELGTAETLLTSATEQIEHLQDELEQEKATRHAVEHRAHALKQLLDDRGNGSAADEELQIPLVFPTTPHEAVSFLTDALKPRVVILDNAVQSTRDLPDFRTRDVWNCLVQLHQTLWSLHFNETDSGATAIESNKIPAEFHRKTRIQYAVHESSMTKQDKDLMRLRQAEIDGEVFDFSPHLKVGSKPSDLLRIHFAIDQTRRRILVWHCGGHLETAGTRRM
jgi:hypothetical protein